MLYLVSIDKLKGENKEYDLTRKEFVEIYLDLVQNGKSSFKGESISFSDSFKRKEIDPEVLREGLELLNRRLLATKLTEDQLIEKIVTTLDEMEKFENFLQQKMEETAVFMKYAVSVKNDFSEQMTKMLKEVKGYVKELEKVLDDYVERSAPNLKKVVGYKVAARLLKSFGGLRNLAMSSSSKVQIIGAEKAFFRFRKGRGTPPKYGIIYEIPDIYKAPRSTSGKISRAYSNAIVKAARADLVGITSESDSKLKRRIDEIRHPPGR
jgi:RNA processing factor Prp31